MNLGFLQTFCVLAETLHFGHAAQRLRLSQSAVSQQIAALEKELGGALFERIGRRVYLTAAGRALAEEATRVFASVSRAREAVAALTAGDAGRLRVGASTTPGIYLLPEVLGRFRVDLPRTELSFRMGNSEEIERALVANELDLGVLGVRPSHDELFEVELGQDEIVLVLAPRLAGKVRRIAPSDLGRWPLISREPGSATRKVVETALAEAGTHLVPAFELPSPEAVIRAAEAGLGLAFVSARAAEEPIRLRRLVRVKLSGLTLVRPIFAAHHRDKRVTPAMRELIELLRARLR